MSGKRRERSRSKSPPPSASHRRITNTSAPSNRHPVTPVVAKTPVRRFRTPRASLPSASKRRRRDRPRDLPDADSLSCVPSALGIVRTAVVGSADKDILIDRLRKEIGERLGLVSAGRGGDEARPVKVSALARRRVVVGTNGTTRALGAAVRGDLPSPLLVILARDMRPPTALAHVPVLCRTLGVPVLLLPGRASAEIGEALGMRSAAAVTFLPPISNLLGSTSGGARGRLGLQEEEERKSKDANRKEDTESHSGFVDSYIAFARRKVPRGGK